MKRRELLKGIAVGTATSLFSRLHAATPNASIARIEVLLNERLGTISPNIYGHFVEHLGGVIYDGVWVGPQSKIPNVGGIRKRLLDDLQQIKAPVIRWPGGCFADQYDWKDGVGSTEKRPARTNFWGGQDQWSAQSKQNFERNEFGTHEFMQLCRLTGAQPYLAANIRSLPAEDFYRWVEYCNSPAQSTTLAKQRAADGDEKPFDVRYWGVGNEAWGCGGNFTPEEYAAQFRHFTSWVPSYGVPLSLVISGASDDDYDWTRRLMRGLLEKGPGQLRSVWGMSVHHYTWNLARGKTNDWDAAKGDALKFDPVDWYELLRQGDTMEPIIEGHWKTLADFDPSHQIKLVIDEWGPWYKPGSEVDPTHSLGQQVTLRDAVLSALTLDTFNRHPDKVAMANCAQLVNCLNSLFLAHEDHFIETPVCHAFAMYAGHQGGDAVRVEFAAPAISYQRDDKRASFWSIKGSASIRDKTLTLTVVNSSVDTPQEAEVLVSGGKIVSAKLTTLTDSDIQAHNTFAEPNAVTPRSESLKVTGGSLRLVLSAASVNCVSLVLG